MADFSASTPGRSRFSKALPTPPSGLLQIEPGKRGRAGPFPVGQRGKMSPFPSPNPLATPSKVALPITPASDRSNLSTPIPQSSAPSATAYERKETALPTPPLPTPLRITIPKTHTTMPASISRRPVGTAVVERGDKRDSDASVASIYSDYGRPRSSTGGSYVTKDSSVGSDHDDYLPPPPPKDPRRSRVISSSSNAASATSTTGSVNLGPGAVIRSPVARTAGAKSNEPHAQPLVRPQTPTRRHVHAESGDIVTPESPGRPEIWRRRSIKSPRSLAIGELKLTKSNGFTLNPLSVNSNPTPIITKELPVPPSHQKQRSQGGGLPGRNIRKPLPTRPAPPQPSSVSDEMAFQKLKDSFKKKEKGDDEPSMPLFDSSNDLSAPASSTKGNERKVQPKKSMKDVSTAARNQQGQPETESMARPAQQEKVRSPYREFELNFSDTSLIPPAARSPDNKFSSSSSTLVAPLRQKNQAARSVSSLATSTEAFPAFSEQAASAATNRSDNRPRASDAVSHTDSVADGVDMVSKAPNRSGIAGTMSASNGSRTTSSPISTGVSDPASSSINPTAKTASSSAIQSHVAPGITTKVLTSTTSSISAAAASSASKTPAVNITLAPTDTTTHSQVSNQSPPARSPAEIFIAARARMPPTPPPGTSMSSCPLKMSQFKCYTKHSSSIELPKSRSPWPASCQICEKWNEHDRQWKCISCILMVCNSCHWLLKLDKNNNPNSEVEVVLTAIGREDKIPAELKS